MPPVVLSLANDPNPKVRQAVAANLELYPLTPEVGEALTGLLDDASPPVRLAATLALASFGKPAVPLLQQMLTDDDVMVRRWAAYSLRRIGRDAEPAIPALVSALADADQNVREMAGAALAQLDPQRFGKGPDVNGGAPAKAR